jgi:hypothetical protein
MGVSPSGSMKARSVMWVWMRALWSSYVLRLVGDDTAALHA